MEAKSYPILLFDLDDTLLSFTKAEAAAFQLIAKGFCLPADPRFFERFRQINSRYWKQLERNETTLEELGPGRFRELFAEFSLSEDPAAVSDAYFRELQYQHQLMDGAAEILSYFMDHRRYIVTNGVDFIQRRRYHDSGLDRLTDGIFISGELGYRKPDPRFLAAVSQRIAGAKEDMLMIGDSLSSDISCGKAFGIATCWLAPAGTPRPYRSEAEYVIEGLGELKEIVRR